MATRSEVHTEQGNAAVPPPREGATPVDSLLQAGEKAVENSKAALKANEELFGQSFALWHDYTRAYTKWVVETTHTALEETMRFRESVDEVLAEGMKRANASAAQERKVMENAASLVQSQAKLSAECMSGMLNAATTVLSSTTPLLDWTTERTNKVLKALSSLG